MRIRAPQDLVAGLALIAVAVFALELSASPTTIGPSPLLGEHRHEILTELGYSDADIAALVKEGAI